jgi:hypothetical protein
MPPSPASPYARLLLERASQAVAALGVDCSTYDLAAEVRIHAAVTALGVDCSTSRGGMYVS